MATAMVSSASALLAMLNENHPILKLHALSNLNALVDYFWPEISTSVPTIESLYEDEAFDQRQLAALVVSKVNIDFSPICNMISTTTLWLRQRASSNCDMSHSCQSHC
eukprot:TRINITY_DN9634_c1_g1_i2.p1 TRINITY_DN9634_c1_g1~~TRINITY_DN9634_c1_g1_i2.p1  ORF type:complete len:108 (+),score=15.20 TRINITY_DN9634_c1_g1_i2:303-626(+)